MTLDADGQHDPAEIPRFLAAYEAGHPELVIGRRDFGSMPPVRRLSNTLGGWVFSAASAVTWRTTSRATGSSGVG